MPRLIAGSLVISLALPLVGCQSNSPRPLVDSVSLAPSRSSPLSTDAAAKDPDHPATSEGPTSGAGRKEGGNPLIKSLERSLLFFPTKFPDGDWKPAGLAFEDV